MDDSRVASVPLGMGCTAGFAMVVGTVAVS